MKLPHRQGFLRTSNGFQSNNVHQQTSLISLFRKIEKNLRRQPYLKKLKVMGVNRKMGGSTFDLIGNPSDVSFSDYTVGS